MESSSECSELQKFICRPVRPSIVPQTVPAGGPLPTKEIRRLCIYCNYINNYYLTLQIHKIHLLLLEPTPKLRALSLGSKSETPTELDKQNKQKMLSGLTNDDVLMNKFEVKNDFLLNN